MKQFIMSACAALLLTACGGGTTPDRDGDVVASPSPHPAPAESLTYRGVSTPKLMAVEEATGALKRLGSLINNPERGVVVVFDDAVKPDGYYTNGAITTGDFSYDAESSLRDYVAGGSTDASWELLEASKEVLRGFFKDPKHVDLVAPIALKEIMGGDAREFLKSSKSVLTAKFVPVPGNASEWYGKFRNPSPEGGNVESEDFATQTAVVKKVIPDLNPSAVSLYMFLHRRYQEGGPELVATYQKWGLRAITD